MDRDKNVKVMGIVALLIAVVSLSVAYAALSTTLNITGTATVNSATWDVHFVAGSFTKVGSGTNVGTPSVSGTSITNLKASLTKPGDSVSYKFKVQNSGSLDAKLATFTSGSPKCSGGSQAADVCSKLKYSIKYSPDATISVGNELAQGQTKDVIMTITYDSSATIVPAEAVNVTGMDVKFIYEQK